MVRTSVAHAVNVFFIGSSLKVGSSNGISARDGLSVFIYQAHAEVAHAGAVDDGATDDIVSLIEMEAVGHAVVGHHAAVAREKEHLAAIQPPLGGRVGTHRKAHIVHRRVTVDDSDHPVDDTVEALQVMLSETHEFQVVGLAVQFVPGQFLGARDDFLRALWRATEVCGLLNLLKEGFHLLPVLGHQAHLLGKIFPAKDFTQVTVGKDGVGAVGLTDGLEDGPPADESLGIGAGGFCSRRQEILLLGVRRKAAESQEAS